MDVLTPALTSKPWIAALLADPTWTHMPTKSRSPKPTGEDSFVAETLMTERTVRAVITFRPSKQEEEEEDVHSNGGMASYKEIKSVVDLGTGLNGYPQIVHGGVAATLLDETCGILVIANADRKVEREREAGRESVAPSYFTACELFSLTFLAVPRCYHDYAGEWCLKASNGADFHPRLKHDV